MAARRRQNAGPDRRFQRELGRHPGGVGARLWSRPRRLGALFRASSFDQTGVRHRPTRFRAQLSTRIQHQCRRDRSLTSRRSGALAEAGEVSEEADPVLANSN